jgi:hypothetical protein
MECGPVSVVGGVDEYDDWGPTVAAAPDGTVWAAWMGRDPEQEDEEIYYSTNEGSGWSAQERLHADNLTPDRFPRLAVSSDGVPWALWNRALSDGYKLSYSRWDGLSWTPPRILRKGASRYDHYDILAAGSGDAWVATDGYVEGASEREILVYHWTGDVWEGPRLLSGPQGENRYPGLGMDPTGRPWVTWMYRPTGGSHNRVLCSTWADTGWTVPDIVNGDAGNMSSPNIVFDGETPMVVWDGNGHMGHGDVEYARLEEGSWTPASLVSAPDSFTDYDHGVDCEARNAGQIWCVWEAGSHGDIFSPAIVASRWSGRGWSAEFPMSGGAENTEDRFPSAALGLDGSLWAVWQCYEEIAPPWDRDIRGTSCLMTTAIDFCCPEATPDGGAVRVTWYAHGAAADETFRVWRLCGAGGESSTSPVPPEGAQSLSPEPIEGPPFEVLDSDPSLGSRCSYWVERCGADGPDFVGPAQIELEDGSAVGPALLLWARPNPATSSWCVGFRQDLPGTVSMTVYDVAGRRVATVPGVPHPPGACDNAGRVLCWDGIGPGGIDAASGVYMARLLFDGQPIPDQSAMLTILK